MKKLTCKQVRRLIDTGRPADWPADLREAVREHVARCASCRRELALTRLLSQAIAEREPATAPADFSARLMRRIAEREQKKAARRPLWPAIVAWRPALAAATVVVVVLLVAVLAYHPNIGPTQPAGQVAEAPADQGTQIAAASDAAFVQDLVMYHKHLELAELGGDAGLLLATNGY